MARTPPRTRKISAPLAGLAALALGAGSAQAQTSIVFASGPDDTGTVKSLIEGFNKAQAGKVKVTWREMARDSSEHRRQLVEAFESEDDVVHLLASDVVWTAEFAQKQWVVDLTRGFYDHYQYSDLLEPSLKSASYRLRRWGIPWYADVSVLFYRKDLLSKSGFDAPPKTWDELAKMAKKVKEDSGIAHGFVFQGAEYEGGTANLLEFIWGAGGRVLRGNLFATTAFGGIAIETDALAIDTPQAARGFDRARSLIADGVSPAAVTGFREKESLEAFTSGDAVFLRSWPYVYGMLAGSAVSPEQVGLAALPAEAAGGVGYSSLGGWNLMIDARGSAKERAAAWKLIRFMTDATQQKRLALKAGLLPTRTALYEDPDLARERPVIGLARRAFAGHVRGRPESPLYPEMSAALAAAFQRVLKGEQSGAEATKALDRELKILLGRYR